MVALKGKSKVALLGSVIAVLALLVGACGSSEDPTAVPQPTSQATAMPDATATPAATATPDTGPKYGGIFRIVMHRDARAGFDFHRTTTISNSFIGAPVWGSGNLVRTCLDDEYVRCAGVAESWDPNADFTQWTFTIRDNVVWHDGTPFTNEDAKFFIDFAVFSVEGRQPDRDARGHFGDVNNVELLPGNQIRVNLDTPAPNYLNALGSTRLMLMHPRHLYLPEIAKGNAEATPAELDAVGTGPFVKDEFVKGAVYRVRRFDQYWDTDAQGRQLPYLDGVDAAVINDRTLAIAAFQTGRLDWTNTSSTLNLFPEQAAQLARAMGDEVTIVTASKGSFIMGFNSINPGPFQDIRVRRAVSLWLDRQSAADAIEPGTGASGTGLWLPGQPWTNPDLLTWPGYNTATKAKDREEAKRLMAEAGFADGFDISLMISDTGTFLAPAEFAVSDLLGLGIKADIKIFTTGPWEQLKCDGAYDFIVDVHTGHLQFPDSTFGVVASVATNPCARTWHNNTRVDDLFEQIIASGDNDERIRLSREVEKLLVEDEVYIAPMYTRKAATPLRSNVKGFQLAQGLDSVEYRDNRVVWLDK